MKAIVCELCGSNELIKDNGMFVCQHCGTKYTTEEARKLLVEATVTVKGPVEVSGVSTANNLLLRAKEFERAGDLDAAESYYNRILDIDVTNTAARDGLSRIEKVIDGPNLTIDFSQGNWGSVATIYVDGNKVDTVNGGETKELMLSYGTHSVGAAGGVFRCKDPQTIKISRSTRYRMSVRFKGLVVRFQVSKVG